MVQMRMRGGDGMWGLWCLVSSMATDSVLGMEGLVKGLLLLRLTV
jgi:hypothetical protein